LERYEEPADESRHNSRVEGVVRFAATAEGRRVCRSGPWSRPYTERVQRELLDEPPNRKRHEYIVGRLLRPRVTQYAEPYVSSEPIRIGTSIPFSQDERWTQQLANGI
jgi:hypothetical protein